MTDNTRTTARQRFDRRGFLGWAGTRGVALGVAGASLPGLLTATGVTAAPRPGARSSRLRTVPPVDEPTAIVGDVVDFALDSDDWEGDFGFVTMRLHKGAVGGNDVYFIRTDASDEAYAADNELVFVPKMASLTGEGLSGAAYVVEEGGDDQPVVFSTEPGNDDYTPAFTLHRVTWSAEPRVLLAEADILDAESAGELAIERTTIVINAGHIKWSSGEMAVDEELTGYLGSGQLIEPVDTEALTATFKLGQCYPQSRYFVVDHSMEGAAEMTQTTFSPGLQGGPTEVGATGRTNVFMNGIEGPGPMGFQPSVFDFGAGDASWSPYWDHFTYAWTDDAEPREITTEEELHEARDAGELEEFPGMPETEGEIFTVNCPVPVLAPMTFEPA